MSAPIHPALASVELDDSVTTHDPATVEAVRLLSACALSFRPTDRWLPEEVVMVAGGIGDLLHAAYWTAQDFVAAHGGPITLIRDHDHPIVTDANGTRYPVLGLYDATKRTLAVNDWSFDARTGGEEGGRRVLLHELAHAWDNRSRYRLSWWLQWLPGARASGYAQASRFEDWAEAVMATVYGAQPEYDDFNQPRAPRRRYVRAAFRRYRSQAR